MKQTASEPAAGHSCIDTRLAWHLMSEWMPPKSEITLMFVMSGLSPRGPVHLLFFQAEIDESQKRITIKD